MSNNLTDTDIVDIDTRSSGVESIVTSDLVLLDNNGDYYYESAMNLLESSDYLGSLFMMAKAFLHNNSNSKEGIFQIENLLQQNQQEDFYFEGDFVESLVDLFVTFYNDSDLREIIENKESGIVKMIDRFLLILPKICFFDIVEKISYDIKRCSDLANISNFYKMILEDVIDYEGLSSVEIEALEDENFLCEMPIFQFQEIGLDGKVLADVRFDGDTRFSFFRKVPFKFNPEQREIMESLLKIGKDFEEKSDEAKLVFKVDLQKITELSLERIMPNSNLQTIGSYQSLQPTQLTTQIL